MRLSRHVATVKTVPGKWDEYLKHLKAYAQRCLARQPGGLRSALNGPVHAVGHETLPWCGPGTSPSLLGGTAAYRGVPIIERGACRSIIIAHRVGRANPKPFRITARP